MVHRARHCCPHTSFIQFVKHASLLREEIGYLLFVLIWRNPSCNELRKQFSRNDDIDAKPLTTQVELGIPSLHLSASTLAGWCLIQRRYSYGLLFIWAHLIVVMFCITFSKISA
ncbi:hypothetical protein AVEN_46163-1 [Araneus ventricosus]|uniref:Uncharacterized protein n=1 Tax=Araneus ventricosus TaxID=182803 RepID=A0A4Y2D8X7_ARAVE|nr:hypothetical protein AVEN_46163-1 [Araneus ventricosus]